MRIHVHEHVTGGELAGLTIPHSLAAEGGAMLRALCADLARMEGVEVVTTLDARLEPFRLDRVDHTSVYGRVETLNAFDLLARRSDATMIVAPESGGALLALTRRALGVGARVLGSAPAAIAIASDKLRLADHLAAHEVACVPATDLDDSRRLPWSPPWVVKPRDGAGCAGVFVASHASELPAGAQGLIATPLRVGLAASVLLVAGSSPPVALTPCEQLLSRGPRLSYRGGRAPLAPPLADRARKLALATVACLPDLGGFVGIDLVLGSDADGADDVVVEVNPRLTTSYTGLRALAQSNLATLALAPLDPSLAVEPQWRDGFVEFEPSGRVRLSNPASTHEARH